MFLGNIERIGGVSRFNQLDAAFGLNNDLLAQSRPVLNNLPEYVLRFPAGINIGMIKKIDADRQGSFNCFMSLFDILSCNRFMVPASAQPHTS
ncbi:hypothetical protein D3C86_1866770 [compost metagenome]